MNGQEQSGPVTETQERAEQEQEALNIMRRVRARLVTEHPFFGDLALRLALKADRSCRDLWTDGRTLAFNPLYAITLSEDRLAGAQAHEVLHLVLGHHLRRANRERTLWNKACDLAINSILLKAGFQLPDGFFYDADLAGMSADEIYEVLQARLTEEAQKGRQRQGRQNLTGMADKSGAALPGQRASSLGMSAPNDGSGKAEDGEDERERSRQEGRGVKPVTGKAGTGKKSSEPIPRFDGEVRDLPDVSLEDGQGAESARRDAEREADVLLTQAVSRARNMGVLPAGLERELGRAEPASLDWQELLQRFLSSCADNDYTWTVPNRRYLCQDIYMPSRWEQRLNHVVVAIDTSGSVDTATLTLFLSELHRVLEFFETTITVLFHDTRVQRLQTISRFDLPGTLMPVGGGGTDFRPIPEALEREGLAPTCLVWFTDLQCSRFPAEPDYPVLWICPRRGGETPPFGELVVMHP